MGAVVIAEVMLPLRTKNWSNSSQGTTRAAMFAKAKAKQEQRDLTRLVLTPGKRKLIAALKQYGLLNVTLTRIAPSSGLDPDDNLRIALKWIKDGVAEVLEVNDRDPRITWHYDQRREKDYAVHVAIGIPPSDCPIARR